MIAGPTGIYDFPLRQQSASQGHWLVPDPAGLAAVDPTNPQTWNRYAYVANNPLSNIDPLGLKVVPCAAGKDPGTICVDDPQPTNYSPGGWWDLAFEGWTGTGSSQSFFCMLFGGCSGSSSWSGGGGQAQPPPQPKPKPQLSTPEQGKLHITEDLFRPHGGGEFRDRGWKELPCTG